MKLRLDILMALMLTAGITTPVLANKGPGIKISFNAASKPSLRASGVNKPIPPKACKPPSCTLKPPKQVPSWAPGRIPPRTGAGPKPPRTPKSLTPAFNPAAKGKK